MCKAEHCSTSEAIESKRLRSAVADDWKHISPQTVNDLKELSCLTGKINICHISNQRDLLVELNLVKNLLNPVPVFLSQRVTGRIVGRCVQNNEKSVLSSGKLLYLVLEIGKIEASILIKHLKVLKSSSKLSGDALVWSPVPVVSQNKVSRA